MSSSSNAPLYLGFDLSTQQLKVIAITSDLTLHHEESVTFDTDLPHYNVQKGVHKNEAENEVYAPVAMWVEAVDLVLERMKVNGGVDFGRVKGVSGAGQQHGSVYWSDKAESILANLSGKAGTPLVDLLSPDAFSHPWSPNWQDHSTQPECDTFEEAVGGADVLARLTGSKAHHRFTGPQILRFRRRFPKVYENTARISLVSSFLCSLFLGRVAPLDISDVCGMNLWDIRRDDWDEKLLSITSGSDGIEELKKMTEDGGEESFELVRKMMGTGNGGVEKLKKKLGDVERQRGGHLGKISGYFVEKFGFDPECTITPFTGDNPSTILALPLRPLDAIISLGTSTTLLMATPTYFPSPSYHLFNHPTTDGLFMFMLCYCNGSLARESIRDKINATSSSSSTIDNSNDPWHKFNETAISTPPLGKTSPTSPAKLGIFFPLPEIVPNVRAGTWRFEYHSNTGKLIPQQQQQNDDSPPNNNESDARAILESQALSMRMRAAPLLTPNPKINNNKPQPRRIYVVGGASRNRAIAKVMGEVLGGVEGVYELNVGSNACALGAAYYAAWALERRIEEEEEGFEEFVGARWKEEGKVKRIADGYKEGVWEAYGEALKGFEEAERTIVESGN